MRKCGCCVHSRLIYNRKHRDEFVGCTQFGSLNKSDEEFITLLDSHKYRSSSNDIVIGWIYTTLKPDDNPEKFNIATAHILANGMLITPRDKAYCDLFRSRYMTDEIEHF